MSSVLKYVLLVVILVAGTVSDQASKQWAAANLKGKPTMTAITNILEFGYTENHGMVFGINNRQENKTSKNLLLTVRILMSIGLVGYIILKRKNSLLLHLPLLLILSGAIGNVIDSLRFGHVIDFIHMHIGTVLDWPFLFNVADAYVSIGMVILIIQSFISDKKKSTQSSKWEKVTA